MKNYQTSLSVFLYKNLKSWKETLKVVMLCKHILKKFIFVMYVALYCLKNKYIFKNKRKERKKREEKRRKEKRKEKKRNFVFVMYVALYCLFNK